MIGDVEGLRITVLPAKPFPCDHPMLDGVFALRLPARGHHVRWVMTAAAGQTVGRQPWGQSTAEVVAGSTGGVVSAVASTVRVMSRARRSIREGADVVVVRNSVRLGLFALVMRRMTGVPFVFQFSFPTAERTLRLAREGRSSVGSLQALMARLAVLLRGRMLRRADVVLAISESMRTALIRSGVQPSRISVVPLGAERATPEPKEVERVRSGLGLDGSPLVLAFGSMAPERRPDFLVEVAERVAESHPEARWLAMGPTSDGNDRKLTAMAEERNLSDRFAVRGPVPRSEVSAYVIASTLTVAAIPDDPLFEMASPTKTVESLALARPVVGTPIPDQDELLTRSGGGIVAPFEANAFAAAVSSLLDDPSRARAMGEAGKRFVTATRSYDHLTDIVEDRLLSAVRNRRS